MNEETFQKAKEIVEAKNLIFGEIANMFRKIDIELGAFSKSILGKTIFQAPFIDSEIEKINDVFAGTKESILDEINEFQNFLMGILDAKFKEL